MNDDSANPVRGPLNRRAVLAAGGVVTASAGVLAVAGCATYGSNSSPAPASTGGAGSTAAAGSTGAGTTGAGSAGAPAEAAGDNAAAAPAGTVVGPTSSVPVGGGKIFADQSVVVTQPTAGTFKAFSAICTHQGCTLSSVSGGTINCPCHGSKFNIADGSVANGPAQRPLPAKQVSATGGQLAVS